MSNSARQWTFDFFKSDVDGMAIRYGMYGAPTTVYKNYVLFLNGRTEWIEKYHFVPEALGLNDDTGFVAIDHRGQGASGGVRGYVDSYDSFGRDVQTLVNIVIGSKPFVVISHSMGGLIGLHATMTGKISPRGIFLSSPLFRLPADPIPHAIGKPVASILSFLGFGTLRTGAGNHGRTSFEGNVLTHSPEHFKIIKNSPYPVPSVSFGWVRATFKAIDDIFRLSNLKKLKCPIFIVAGSEEAVVDSQGFDAWIQDAKSIVETEIKFELVSGGRHELLSEVPKYYDEVIGKMTNWMKSKLQG